MDEQLRSRADARLDSALVARGLADPRETYRGRLRALREASPELFATALRHYEEVVLPDLAEGEDPVGAWIEYGRYLADLVSPGRAVAIDALGRADAWAPAGAGPLLVLHLPDDRTGAAQALVAPLEPTPAQRAAHDLLVLGRLGL
jgi:hypothetical protein